MNGLEEWAFSLTLTLIVLSVIENILMLCRNANSVTWLIKLILVCQLLEPVNRLIVWMRGG